MGGLTFFEAWAPSGFLKTLETNPNGGFPTNGPWEGYPQTNTDTHTHPFLGGGGGLEGALGKVKVKLGERLLRTIRCDAIKTWAEGRTLLPAGQYLA